MKLNMAKVYIGVGSNLGDKRENIFKALEMLNQASEIEINKCSSIYKTKPFGHIRQPDFFNAAWEVETALQPEILLAVLKNIERKIGRKKTFRWGPRVIDLDILTYGNKKIKTKNLTVPHPEMQHRDFVLQPLREIK